MKFKLFRLRLSVYPLKATRVTEFKTFKLNKETFIINFRYVDHSCSQEKPPIHRNIKQLTKNHNVGKHKQLFHVKHYLV